MAGSADISDPRVIREFRGRMSRFQQQAAAALAGAPTALSRTSDMLRFEVGPRWKKELSRRQEQFAEVRRKWQEAEAEVKAKGQRGQVDRASAADEHREMLRAQRRCEEAEEKLKAVRTWLTRLDGDGKDLLARCRDQDLAIQDLAVKAMARLERMADSLDEYQQRAGGTP
jgi:chromosome segregation ATPase